MALHKNTHLPHHILRGIHSGSSGRGSGACRHARTRGSSTFKQRLVGAKRSDKRRGACEAVCCGSGAAAEGKALLHGEEGQVEETAAGVVVDEHHLLFFVWLWAQCVTVFCILWMETHGMLNCINEGRKEARVNCLMICFVCAACVCVCVYKALALGCVERRAVKREEAKTDVLYAHTKNYKQSPPGQNTHTHFLVGERRTHVPK